jgi:DNA-binding MarR family transcriptional regulator
MFVIRAPVASCAAAVRRDASGAAAGSAGGILVMPPSWRARGASLRSAHADGDLALRVPGRERGERLGCLGKLVGLLLALTGHEAMRRLRAAHTAHALKPRQFQILGLLHDHGGLAQRDLIREMAVDPSILVTLLNPLEADGFVARERDPADRRRHLVTLTPAGERHLASASQAQKDVDDALFASLTDEQREQLRGLLLALSDGLAVIPT